MNLQFPSPAFRTTRVALAAALAGFLVLVSRPVRGAGGGLSYPTPEDAVEALGRAAATTNRQVFIQLFGDQADGLINPDSIQGQADLVDFNAAFQKSHRLVSDSETRRTLEVGPDRWPFPIPLVKSAGGWRFDAAAGAEELLNRRIGRNELEVLKVLRAYVQAQREYARMDRDGDEVLEYAQLLASSPGRMDGLYWPPELNGEMSPLGPLAAEAQSGGYRTRSAEMKPQPFHGYYFKILQAQGRHAPGGKYRYVINGNMIGGFALVAWPAEYGNSGVMTFIVSHQGRVHERDLGPKTRQIASRMEAFDPGPGWHPSRD